MPESARLIDFFFDHLLITVIGAGSGMLIGGILGYLLGRIYVNLYGASERWRKFALLFPWRTLAFGLIAPNIIPLIVTIRIGLGNESAMVSLGIAVTILALAFTPQILIRRSFPLSQQVEFIAMVRTILTGSGMLLAAFAGIGSGNLGEIISQLIRVMEYRMAVNAYLLLLISMLIFDLAIGVIQYIYTQRVISHTD